MDIELYKKKLEGKTFLFKIGHYNFLGGAEVAAILLAKKLKNELSANIIFVADGSAGPVREKLESFGFKTCSFNFRFYGKKWHKLIDYIRFALYLRRLKADFLLPYVSDNCKMILPIWKYTGAKYAWWMMQDEGRGLFKTKFEKWVINQASDIVSNSSIGIDFLHKNYMIPSEKIIHYNNIIQVPPQSEINPYWKKRLGIDDTTILVSMVANITKYKDHKTLFKAWQIVQKHFLEKKQSILLVLAGKQLETTNELKILGFDLQISQSVKFLGSIETTIELLYESDLVVHSSLTEGCPNAVCEAMALGKAVIATNIPGNREAITNKFEKYCLSEPYDERDLADKIIFTLENQQLAKDIGEYNKIRIINDYNEERIFEKFIPMFAKAIIN